MATDSKSAAAKSVWVILPVKGAGKNGKQRLAPLLTDVARAALSRAMLDDVLQQLSTVTVLDGILLVSSDPSLAVLAERFPVTFYREPSDNVAGLNGAVAAAAQHLAERGVATAVVIHSDLPLFCATELERLLSCHLAAEGQRVTLVPDDRQDGTNVLVATPPEALPFAYGGNSFNRYHQLAKTHQIAVAVWPSQSLGLDIDTPQDLRQLAERCRLEPRYGARHSCRILTELSVPVSDSTPANIEVSSR